MSTTRELRIRELERQAARRSARLKALEIGAARALAGALMLRSYTDNWDGPGGGTPCSGNATINAACNGVGSLLSGATVTATDGTHTVTGTAGSGGSVTLSPGYAGVWTFTVAKAGFLTYNGSFTFACANVNVSAPMITTSATVVGNVACTAGAAISGASVVVTQTSTGTVIGTGTTDSAGNYSIPVSGYTAHGVTVTFSATNYTTAASTATLACTGNTLVNRQLAPVAGRFCQCNGLAANSTALTFSSGGYSTTLTYDSGVSRYVGYLTVNCRAVTGLGCSKGTADVTLMIQYQPSNCGLTVTFKRQGVGSATCTGTGGIDIPSSDAWCASLSGPGGCSDISFYGNGTHSFSSATGYPFVATYSGVLFRDADSNAFLTNATVSE